MGEKQCFMLKCLLVINVFISFVSTLIAQKEKAAIEFLEARSAQIKELRTGHYDITIKMKFLFETDTSEFKGKGFFEHQRLEDTTFFKVHTYEEQLNISHLYLGEMDHYYLVNHDEKLIEVWMNIPFTQMGADQFIFKPLVFEDYMEDKIPESDSIWLEVDALLKADVLCFLDKAAPPTSQVKVENDLVRIYFNQDGLPFRMTSSLDLVDYGVSEYRDQEIHFLYTNIPSLSDMHQIYGERGYSYQDGLENDKTHDKKRDSMQMDIGSVAPIWQATSYTGQEIDLAKVSSKLILLDFWYKGCFSCMQSMPLLNELHEKYVDKGLTIIGVNPYQSKAEEMLPFLEHKGIQHPNVYSPSIPSLYGVFAYPSYIFLDENKKVVKVQRGYGKGETDVDFKQWIEAYLNK